jgi:hypothetical protein
LADDARQIRRAVMRGDRARQVQQVAMGDVRHEHRAGRVLVAVHRGEIHIEDPERGRASVCTH